jgi:beta-mannosidase
MAKAQALNVDRLSEGWAFKQTGDTTKDAWMPVKKVPTNVHLDLMDNGKYVVAFGMLDESGDN